MREKGKKKATWIFELFSVKTEVSK